MIGREGVLHVENLDLRIQLCRWRSMANWRLRDPQPLIWRFYWNPTPGAWVACHGKKLPLVPDRWVLITPGAAFSTDHRGPFEHLFAHFVLGPHVGLKQGGCYTGKPTKEQKQSLMALAAAGRAGEAIHRALQVELAAILTASLCTIPAEAWRPPISDTRIRRVLATVHADPRKRWRNAELAALVHMHPNSLIRLFASEVGLPPQQYALLMRLNGACEQLLSGDESVEQTAADWNFSDRYHLTRLMSRHLHTSPGRLRREAR